MIHVQIASQITPTGVDGIRWVLVEASATPAGAAPPPAVTLAAAVAAAQTPAREAGVRQQLSLALLKAAVLGLGLGSALWAAQTWLGPTTVPWLAPTAQPRPTEGPGGTAAPMPLAPAAPASAPLVTAELR